jgi:phage terminase small subunit
MGILKNPRHEAFARLYVATGIARHAYVKAGYKARLPDDPQDTGSADVCASKLLKHPKVERRVEGLRQAMAKRQDITEESILEELEQARQCALGERQSAAMVSASVAKAKLVGLMVERKEVGNAGDFQRMSEQELRDWLANNAPKPLPTHAQHETEQ